MIISRDQAKTLNLKRYITGEACRHGHSAERYTINGACVECSSATYKAWSRENSAAEKDARRARYERDIAKVRGQSEEWRSKNTSSIRRQTKEWRQNNTEGERAIKARRRARVAAAKGKWYPADIIRINGHQGGLCAGCSTSLVLTGYHIDHKNPLSLGGSNWPENLQLLCPSCNTRKWATPYNEWISKKEAAQTKTNLSLT